MAPSLLDPSIYWTGCSSCMRINKLKLLSLYYRVGTHLPYPQHSPFLSLPPPSVSNNNLFPRSQCCCLVRASCFQTLGWKRCQSKIQQIKSRLFRCSRDDVEFSRGHFRFNLPQKMFVLKCSAESPGAFSPQQ